MRETLDMIELREQHVTRLIQKEVEGARARAAANNKKEALECMKRKRIHDKELERLAAQRLTVMQAEQTLHALKFNSLVVEATTIGAAAIEREVQRAGGIEGVEKLNERLEDALADGDELLTANSRLIGDAATLDDDELYEELEQMELAEMTSKLTETHIDNETDSGQASLSSGPVTAHAVPQHLPFLHPVNGHQEARRAEEEREERELAELAAVMKMEPAIPMPMMAACC